MKKITEVFVILEDKPGSISQLTRVLKKKNIAINAIGLFIDTARLHLSKPEIALQALLENGYQAELREVLSVSLENRTGALMELTQKLANAQININYLYGTMEKGQKRCTVILDVDNPSLVMDIFRNDKF